MKTEAKDHYTWWAIYNRNNHDFQTLELRQLKEKNTIQFEILVVEGKGNLEILRSLVTERS